MFNLYQFSKKLYDKDVADLQKAHNNGMSKKKFKIMTDNLKKIRIKTIVQAKKRWFGEDQDSDMASTTLKNTYQAPARYINRAKAWYSR